MAQGLGSDRPDGVLLVSGCKTGECLAAWLDSEPCICDVPSGVPQELSVDKLRRASRLVDEIKAIDRALDSMGTAPRNVRGPLPFPSRRTTIWYDGDNCRIEVHIPNEIAMGLLRTMRFHAMVKLQETGVVTTGQGHRPVIAK